MSRKCEDCGAPIPEVDDVAAYTVQTSAGPIKVRPFTGKIAALLRNGSTIDVIGTPYHEDDLYDRVRRGEVTGFSIGGYVRRKPDPPPIRISRQGGRRAPKERTRESTGGGEFTFCDEARPSLPCHLSDLGPRHRVDRARSGSARTGFVELTCGRQGGGPFRAAGPPQETLEEAQRDRNERVQRELKLIRELKETEVERDFARAAHRRSRQYVYWAWAVILAVFAVEVLRGVLR